MKQIVPDESVSPEKLAAPVTRMSHPGIPGSPGSWTPFAFSS